MTAERAAPADRVQISTGTVVGDMQDGVRVWRGIPFAGSASGINRFAPPQPVPAWTGDLRCTGYGPTSWQGPNTDDVEPMPPGISMAEDCLNLTVWSPDDSGPHPVLVWIHGGGFVANTASGPWTDGAALARQERIVVVAVEYRLGALGGLSVPEAGTPSGNFVLDPVAALRWVGQEIAAFGGDPKQVTVGGQSAGAMITAALLTSPLAAGLFGRAIVMSGHGSATWTAQQAADVRETFDTITGGTSLDDLRAFSAAEVIDAQTATQQALRRLPFRPIAGYADLPRDPLGAARARTVPQVPVLIGTALDENRLFSGMGWAPPDDRPLVDRMRGLGLDEEQAGALATAYGALAEGPNTAWDVFSTDKDWRAPNREFALALSEAGSAVYRYEFVFRSPAHEGIFGACHSMDLPFAFDNLDAPAVAAFTGDDRQAPARRSVARTFSQVFGSFVRTGRPSADGTPVWPEYDGVDQVVMTIGELPTAGEDRHRGRLDRLRRLGPGLAALP